MLRTATIDDATQIREVLESDRASNWFTNRRDMGDSDFEKTLALNLHAAMCTVAVLERDGLIVGVGFVERRGDQHSDASLVVRPEYRRHGVGEKILRFLVDWGRAEPGLERLYGKVAETNDASRALCEKVGFSEDWQRAPHYGVIDGLNQRILQLYIDVLS